MTKKNKGIYITIRFRRDDHRKTNFCGRIDCYDYRLTHSVYHTTIFIWWSSCLNKFSYNIIRSSWFSRNSLKFLHWLKLGSSIFWFDDRMYMLRSMYCQVNQIVLGRSWTPMWGWTRYLGRQLISTDISSSSLVLFMLTTAHIGWNRELESCLRYFSLGFQMDSVAIILHLREMTDYKNRTPFVLRKSLFMFLLYFLGCHEVVLGARAAVCVRFLPSTHTWF